MVFIPKSSRCSLITCLVLRTSWAILERSSFSNYQQINLKDKSTETTLDEVISTVVRRYTQRQTLAIFLVIEEAFKAMKESLARIALEGCLTH